MVNDQLSSLESTGIRFVRFTWCDNANMIRAKAVHVSQLSHYVDYGVGVTAGAQGLPVMYDAVVPESGLTPVGEIRLMADWSTLTPLPFSPGHARVLGDFALDGVPWELCPRHFLMRMSAEAARNGIEVQAAFENEFFLLQQTPEAIVPADDTVFAASWGMDRNCRVINDIADALLEQKIPVEMYYPESAPGQHEVPVRYTHVLQAADRQIAFRETVRAVALRHGLKASFLPKIFADKAGSGCHFHFSLWREGKNLMADEGSRSPRISTISWSDFPRKSIHPRRTS